MGGADLHDHQPACPSFRNYTQPQEQSPGVRFDAKSHWRRLEMTGSDGLRCHRGSNPLLTAKACLLLPYPYGRWQARLHEGPFLGLCRRWSQASLAVGVDSLPVIDQKLEQNGSFPYRRIHTPDPKQKSTGSKSRRLTCPVSRRASLAREGRLKWRVSSRHSTTCTQSFQGAGQ